MTKLDAATLAQQAVRLGLMSEAQLQECQKDLNSSTEPEAFLRAVERKRYLTPWQSQKLLKGDQDGYFLGGYRLLYKIASGSFGRVFRADDPRTGLVVAIKVLRQRFNEASREIQLFEREGRVGQSLQHPNIVSILGINSDRITKQFYIVMEFVEGGNLRDFLAIRKKLIPAEALRLIDDTVNGLAYAYARGITHRDIKPTNILISAQGTAKLVDFGMAGIYSQEADAESKKMYRTVDYAGLEKATGVPSGDVRSDIYFLGCVLYEMLTGRAPLDLTKDSRARMNRDRFNNACVLTTRDVDGPQSVVDLVNTMMALDVNLRYQTPSQLLEAIRDARRQVEGTDVPGLGPVTRSVFIVENNAKLQDTLRDKFKKLGYRVFLSSDPEVALSRFRQKPFDALVLDAGSGNKASVEAFDKIIAEAAHKKRKCAGILILSAEQANLAKTIAPSPDVAVIVRPLTLGQLTTKLRELVPPPST